MHDRDGAIGSPSLLSFRGRSVAGGFKRHASSEAVQSPVYTCISALDLSTPLPGRLTCDSDAIPPLLLLDESDSPRPCSLADSPKPARAEDIVPMKDWKGKDATGERVVRWPRRVKIQLEQEQLPMDWRKAGDFGECGVSVGR